MLVVVGVVVVGAATAAIAALRLASSWRANDSRKECLREINRAKKDEKHN